MSESISIKSAIREYSVFFRDDIAKDIEREACAGAFFIVDANIMRLYGGLSASFPKNMTLVVEPTEKNKTLEKCKDVIEDLVEKKIRKNNSLIAVGGGIIQDITAFTASILYRGIDWKFIPTTLLAQGDSCIGSKTSINLGDKKNLIGNFYPPTAVYICHQFLESLDISDIKSGIGEMIHFYIYSGSEYFERIIQNYDAIVSDRSLIKNYTRESLSIKKSVIEIDEYDRGERNKFNYGHTFGHALESVSNYDIKHGQAVTVGMDLANYVALNYGIMEKGVYENLHRLLTVNVPSYPYQQINVPEYVKALSKDKKNVGNDLVCILAEKPGHLLKRQLAMDARFQEIVRTYFQKIIRHRSRS
jgi:3-dehydroquinate synthase